MFAEGQREKEGSEGIMDCQNRQPANQHDGKEGGNTVITQHLTGSEKEKHEKGERRKKTGILRPAL